MLVVVLEHSEVNKEHIREMFATTIPGAEVAVFSRMEEAYNFCTEQYPDVIFAELEKQKNDCLAFVRQLWNAPRDYNIIVVSDPGQCKNIALECFKMTVSDCLEKPLTPQAIKESLKGLRYSLDKNK